MQTSSYSRNTQEMVNKDLVKPIRSRQNTGFDNKEEPINTFE